MDSQSPLPAEDFRLLFEATPSPLLILRPDCAFTIAAASDAYLKETLTVREEIIGKGVFDVFPDNPAVPEAGATTNLRASLATVVATKKPHVMAIQRYDVPNRTEGGFEFRYWSPVNAPVLAADGRLLYIVHRVENVTAYVHSLEANEALRERSRLLQEELSKSEAQVFRHGEALSATTLALQKATEEADAWRLGEEKFRLITDALPHIVWTARPDGYVDYYNQHFCDFAGASPPSADGAEWEHFVHPEDLDSVKTAWNHSVATGDPYETVFRVRHHSGTYRWTLARAVAVRDNDAAIVKWIGSNTDIHEKVLAEHELREAHRRKDDFLAMLAHELRNPLAPIVAGAEMLSMLLSEDARVLQVSDVIRRQIGHMKSLIDGLLDVSRVTRGLISLDKRILDIHQIVHESVEQVRPLIEAHKHRLTLQLAADVLCVCGDHKRLVQLLSNLLNNAAKYTADGGRLNLTTKASPTEVIVSVEDNGIGMTPELLRTAFDLFQQGGRTAVRAEDGLGIGLALVKSLVEQHEGTVSASSKGTGQGSEFIVRFPRVDGEPADVIVDERKPARGEARSRRVLVVDDNVDVADSLGMVLEVLGNAVVVEHEAQSAIKRAQREPFDVFILDIGLPGMNGYELARELRALSGAEDAIFVAYTGYGQEEDRRLSDEAGFAHHLVKPVGIIELQQVLADHGD
ncbi:PAS/PAC sensor hybrid histidine kinase [Caballeronia arationis]|jgi:PAS domain S-box-containing protein|uniref:histidine kinase n=1 Tax=Caballeronia arationis TaxID=1777142 RepID=A0A7Z7IAZ1_9BURK|nr:ATP-binding protein [Caballeronia arationis]SAK62054.1 PAS/PAC sensor hybrid histidine kinase [Caballeronia arationis]SOE82530.1 PAS domain S-box-containing protein [Caballeronia arationis]